MKNNFIPSLVVMSVISLLVFAAGIYLQQNEISDLGKRLSNYGILFLALTLFFHFKRIYI